MKLLVVATGGDVRPGRRPGEGSYGPLMPWICEDSLPACCGPDTHYGILPGGGNAGIIRGTGQGVNGAGVLAEDQRMRPREGVPDLHAAVKAGAGDTCSGQPRKREDPVLGAMRVTASSALHFPDLHGAIPIIAAG